MGLRALAACIGCADSFAAGHELGIRRYFQPRGHAAQRKIRDALSRARCAGTSRLGYAESTDGIHFARRAEPVLSPETEYEKDGGVEDPRLQKFGDTYYLTYTDTTRRTRSSAWPHPPVSELIGSAKASSSQRTKETGTRDGRSRAPSFQNRSTENTGCIGWEPAPTKRSDGAFLFHRPAALDGSDANSGAAATPWQIRFARGRAGPPPILTESGIVLVYNGADDKLIYRAGVAVFDRKDPRKLLSRTDTRSSARRKSGRKLARYRTLSSWKGWRVRETVGFFTTAERTSTWEWPRHPCSDRTRGPI